MHDRPDDRLPGGPARPPSGAPTEPTADAAPTAEAAPTEPTADAAPRSAGDVGSGEGGKAAEGPGAGEGDEPAGDVGSGEGGKAAGVGVGGGVWRAPDGGEGAGRRLGVLVGALAVAGVAVVVAGPGTIGGWLEAVGESAWGPPTFVAAFALAVVALMPGTIGTVAAGAVFGFRLGFVVALSGATIGAGAAFLVARWLGRDGVERILGRRRVRWYRPVEAWIAGNDFASILVLRVMPIVPFNGLNYAAGLAPVRFSRYLPASIVGMAPGTALVAFAAAESGDPTGPRFLAAMSAVAVATVLSIVASRHLRARHA